MCVYMYIYICQEAGVLGDGRVYGLGFRNELIP